MCAHDIGSGKHDRPATDGELKVTKVGTHNRIPLAEYERFRHELMVRIAAASAAEIAADLFGGSGT